MNLGQFIPHALDAEFTTQGGFINALLVVVLSSVMVGGDKSDALFQVLAFLWRTLDRLMMFFEKVLEFVALMVRPDSPFRAGSISGPYEAPELLQERTKSLIALAVLGIACVVAVGAQHYVPSTR